MTRATSKEMYDQVKASGYLSNMRLRVYEILCRHDYSKQTGVRGLTAHEVRYYGETLFHYTNSEHLPKRLSELERHGVIEVVDKRACRRTGNTALAWAVTGRMPIKIEATLSTKEMNKEKALARLRIVYGMIDKKCTDILGNINMVADLIEKI